MFEDLRDTSVGQRVHLAPDDEEFMPCGCAWWLCMHCPHGGHRDICMICDDPFAEVGR